MLASWCHEGRTEVVVSWPGSVRIWEDHTHLPIVDGPRPYSINVVLPPDVPLVAEHQVGPNFVSFHGTGDGHSNYMLEAATIPPAPIQASRGSRASSSRCPFPPVCTPMSLRTRPIGPLR